MQPVTAARQYCPRAAFMRLMEFLVDVIGLTEMKPASRLGELLHKFETDALFRRVCIGSPTWAEMLVAALMEDRTGVPHVMARHNAASIDVTADNGSHIQVKRLGTKGSIAMIRKGRDTAASVMIVTVFGERPRFYLVPMDAFKDRAKTYAKSGPAVPREQAQQWEISAGKIARGYIDEFEIEPEQAVSLVAL